MQTYMYIERVLHADQCGWVGGWVNQAYSRLSTTHGHITDCKLDSVVYASILINVGVFLILNKLLCTTVLKLLPSDSGDYNTFF